MITGGLPCKPCMLLWKKVPGRNLANCSQQSRRGAECKGGWESYFSVKINGKKRCNEHVLEFKQRHKKGKGGGGEGKQGGTISIVYTIVFLETDNTFVHKRQMCIFTIKWR